MVWFLAARVLPALGSLESFSDLVSFFANITDVVNHRLLAGRVLIDVLYGRL